MAWSAPIRLYRSKKACLYHIESTAAADGDLTLEGAFGGQPVEHAVFTATTAGGQGIYWAESVIGGGIADVTMRRDAAGPAGTVAGRLWVFSCDPFTGSRMRV